MRRQLLRVATAGLTLSVALMPAAVAAADPEDSPSPAEVKAQTRLENIQAGAEEAIARRLDSIAQMQESVSDSEALTEEHRGALADRLTAATTGLTALGATIAADTDPVAAADHARQIVDDYRVYLLLLPSTRLVMASDGVVAAADRLDAAAVTLDSLIATAKSVGKDTTQAEAAVAAMREHVAAARSLIDTISGEMLAIEPSGWPDNAAVRDQARADVAAATEELRQARAAASEAAHALRALV